MLWHKQACAESRMGKEHAHTSTVRGWPVYLPSLQTADSVSTHQEKMKQALPLVAMWMSVMSAQKYSSGYHPVHSLVQCQGLAIRIWNIEKYKITYFLEEAR